MKLYNHSLKIKRGIGDQKGVANTQNNMAVVLINKEKYEESLFYVLQAYTISQRRFTSRAQEILRKRSLSKTRRKDKKTVELTATIIL